MLIVGYEVRAPALLPVCGSICNMEFTRSGCGYLVTFSSELVRESKHNNHMCLELNELQIRYLVLSTHAHKAAF